MKASFFLLTSLGVLLRTTAASWTNTNKSTTLPIIDLGYGRHQAISFNENSGTYNFSNIRYGQPPVGNLRFRAPLPVKGNNSNISTGSVGSICPQPASLFSDPVLIQWITAYVQGTILDFNELREQAGIQASPVSSSDPRVTEDCLFLDVIVPKTILDKRGSSNAAPVLIWIHGGGYIVGEKTGFGRYNPDGIFQASREAGDDGFIFVSINYRLGAFGFLGGSTLQRDGAANAGLLDQRLALEWVKENIHLFGGSADRVTVMGESAGGGSTLYQLTAYGASQGPVPFQQIIPQSPGTQFAASPQSVEDVLQTFMATVNASTLDELRAASFTSLNFANTFLAGTERQGFFGPSVDSTFIPQHFSQLVSNGAFDQSVTALIGTNANEGILFSDPTVNSSATYTTYIRGLIPGISEASVSYITNVLYPPVFDGSFGYTSQFERGVRTFEEFTFTCNAPIISWGLQNLTNNYNFAVSPGLHAQDVAYTFYNGPETGAGGITAPPTTPTEIRLAGILQSWIATFVVQGTPKAADTLPFEPYGSDASVLVMGESGTLNSTGLSRGADPAFVHGRCAWLSEAVGEEILLE